MIRNRACAIALIIFALAVAFEVRVVVAAHAASPAKTVGGSGSTRKSEVRRTGAASGARHHGRRAELHEAASVRRPRGRFGG